MCISMNECNATGGPHCPNFSWRPFQSHVVWGCILWMKKLKPRSATGLARASEACWHARSHVEVVPFQSTSLISLSFKCPFPKRKQQGWGNVSVGEAFVIYVFQDLASDLQNPWKAWGGSAGHGMIGEDGRLTQRIPEACRLGKSKQESLSRERGGWGLPLKFFSDLHRCTEI